MREKLIEQIHEAFYGKSLNWGEATPEYRRKMKRVVEFVEKNYTHNSIVADKSRELEVAERRQKVLSEYFQAGGILYNEVIDETMGLDLVQGVPVIAKKYFELKRQRDRAQSVAEARQREFEGLRKRLKVPGCEWVTPYVVKALDELDALKKRKKSRKVTSSEGWEAKVKAAHDMVHALCQPRGSEGSRTWVMSIPAREDYDPDLVITGGLMAAEAHIKGLENTLEEYKRMLKAEESNCEHWKAKYTDSHKHESVPVKVRLDVTAAQAAQMMQNIKSRLHEYSEMVYESWDTLGENYKEDFVKTFEELLPHLAAHAVIDVPTVVPTDAQVEALVNVLHDLGSSNYGEIARAIFAHIGASERPKGLPTREELALSMFVATGANDGNYTEGVKKLHLIAADRALEMLAPYLHDPVGCELDVGGIEALKVFRAVLRKGAHRNIDDLEAIKAVLDLCRSRIRPVYECKECAKLESQYQDLINVTNEEADRINRAMDAINEARAALEGE